MSKKYVKPVLGRDYAVKKNGTIVVSRDVSLQSALVPQSKDPIPNVLSAVDHSLRIGKKEAIERIADEEHKFRRLVFDHLVTSDYSLVVGLQGYDASGKSGAADLLWQGSGKNSKVFKIASYGKPDPVELRFPHFKRFFDHERFPGKGQVRVLDRFWCERMLVERVKKLASPEDLQRSYAEITAFEWLLHVNKVILVKFWMDISKAEQNRRFEDRARDAREKLSPDDKEAQAKRHLYKRYANEMFFRNSPSFAPWHIISSENKKYSRVTILENVNDALRQTFGL
ncbi:MAG TPA: hypothetical protein V6D22_19915 [Candidatus Obscuribacterales bacterium]